MKWIPAYSRSVESGFRSQKCHEREPGSIRGFDPDGTLTVFQPVSCRILVEQDLLADDNVFAGQP